MSQFVKHSELLLLPEDELELAGAIQALFPAVRFVDNRRWEAVDSPPSHSSILECSRTAAIWNPDIFPKLPTSVRENGVIDGPQAGPVVQWLRSFIDHNGNLQAGRWAASNDAETEGEMVAFAQSIWKLLMKQTTNKLRRGGSLGFPPQPNIAERQFRVGRRALQAALNGEIVLASNQMRLLPEQSA